MDASLSNRISILRFPLIIGVLFIHNYNTVVSYAAGKIGGASLGFASVFVRNYVSDVLACISVPLFFLMSGYLFFYKFDWSLENFYLKIKSRIRTLFVPYIFWNIFVLIIIAVAQAIPATANYFSGRYKLISSYSLLDYINVFGLTQRPISYQFWFIRDLMALLLLAPFTTLMLKSLPYLSLVFLLISWFLNFWPLPYPYVVSFFFFYSGGFLYLQQYDLRRVDAFGPPLVALYIVLSTADALTKGAWFNDTLHKVGILIGIGFVFFLTRYIERSERYKKCFLMLASASFFLFAAHEPLLMILKKLSYKAFQPVSESGIIALYFIIPVIVTVICLTTYSVLIRIMPVFTKIITGGR